MKKLFSIAVILLLLVLFPLSALAATYPATNWADLQTILNNTVFSDGDVIITNSQITIPAGNTATIPSTVTLYTLSTFYIYGELVIHGVLENDHNIYNAGTDQ